MWRSATSRGGPLSELLRTAVVRVAGARDRRIRGHSPRDHPRAEVLRPFVTGKTACRRNAHSWQGRARTCRRRGACPSALEPRAPAGLQSSPRDRTASRSAGRRCPSPMSCNASTNRVGCRPAVRERGWCISVAQRLVSRSCCSRKERAADRRRQHYRRNVGSVRARAAGKWRRSGLCPHRRASGHTAAPQPSLIPNPQSLIPNSNRSLIPSP
jgi:hypothetical protein